jgi:hypothetical protein
VAGTALPALQKGIVHKKTYWMDLNPASAQLGGFQKLLVQL